MCLFWGSFIWVTRLQHYKNVIDQLQQWSWRNNNYDVQGTTPTLQAIRETDQLFITISSYSIQNRKCLKSSKAIYFALT